MTDKIAKNETTGKLVTAHARHLHISPRKIRLVTNLVKGMYVSDALAQLAHTNKKAAGMVVKVLDSAIANAKQNFSLEAENLFIKSITADMGQVMKRYFPRARGSAFVIRRKTSHVNVVLAEKKRGKSAASRLAFLKKATKPAEQASAENIDQKEATNQRQEKQPAKKQAFKAEDQVKQNKVQNKRRLFNRKGGE